MGVLDGITDSLMLISAYEILSNPRKRRAYDSVDPKFDETIPGITDYNKEHFFEVFTPIFKSNAR